MSRGQGEGQGREIQQPAKGEPRDFPALLEASKPEIARVLPEGVSVDRVSRMALTAFRLNPDLRDCTPASILGSVMKAAELGLEPGGGLRQCWLIPYWDHKKKIRECTFQISYNGMIELARRSGAFRAIEARVVFEKDLFSLEYDPRPKLNHVPNLFDQGAEIGAYAYAILASGEAVIEWANRAEIEKIRSVSKAGNIWNQWWGQMACKTLLKRLLKRQPQSVQLARAIDADNADGRIEASLVEGRAPALAGPTRSAALAQRLRPAALPGPESEELDVEDYGGPAEESESRELGEDG